MAERERLESPSARAKNRIHASIVVCSRASAARTGGTMEGLSSVARRMTPTP